MEINTKRVQLRVVGSDGMTSWERFSINALISNLGYSDVEDLAEEAGFDSAREMAYNHNFKNVRDFFLGDGWYDRLAEYDKTPRALPLEK